MKILYLSIIVILSITLFVGNCAVFAHTIPSPFTSSTDKTEYDAEEVIKISGSVANEIIKANQPVIIQIFNPNGTQYENATVDLEPQESYTNGYYNYGYTYKYDLKIGDDAVPGNYQIVVYYDKSLQSSYTITYDKTHVDYNNYFVYNVFLNNETYPIRYKLTEGNEIRGIGSIDTESNFFSIAVRGMENKTGQLTLELPRMIIDSKYSDSTDKNFTIAMGGAGAMIGYTNDFKEIQKNAENRTLQFNIAPYDVDYLVFVYGTQSINQNVIMQNNLILSPLKQFKSGTSAQNVICKEGLVLVIKASDSSPACVHSDIVPKLFARGWASYSHFALRPSETFENRTITIGKHQYYYTTVNDTMTTYRGEGVQTTFHNVVFTFLPSPYYGGPIGGCGGFEFKSSAKFSDDVLEFLRVDVPEVRCLKNYSELDLTQHTYPQAGLAVYGDGKIRLLVSAENQSDAN